MDIIIMFLNQSIVTLWAISWQITILFVLILVISLFCRKASTNFRYWLWFIILLRLCIPVEIKLPIGIGENIKQLVLSTSFQLKEKPYVKSKSQSISSTSKFKTPSLETSEEEFISELKLDSEKTTPIFTIPEYSSFTNIALCWLGLVIIIAFLVIWRAVYTYSLIKKSHIIKRPELEDALRQLCQRIDVHHKVILRCINFSEDFEPAVVGFLKPVIYLPRKMAEKWDIKDLEPILLHELAHIKRYDIIINWLQVFTIVIYFFHPLVWFVNWKIRRLREDACDDMVINYIGEKRLWYAEKILCVIRELSNKPVFSSIKIGFIETKHSLAKRIIRIIDVNYRNCPKMKTLSWVYLAIIAMISISLASGKTVKKEPVKYIDKEVNFNENEYSIEELRISYQNNPDDIEVALRYALNLYENYYYRDALVIFEKLIPISFKDPIKISKIHLNLAICYEKTGKPLKAINIYKNAEKKGLITTSEQKAQSYSMLGEHYFNENQYNLAIKHFQQLPRDLQQVKDVQVKFNVSINRILLAFSYYHIGNEQSGKLILDKAFAEVYAEKNYMVMAQFANLCIMHNLYIKESFPWAEKAAEICKDYNYTVVSQYGILAGMNKEYGKAEGIWNNILRITPESDVAYDIWKGFKFEASANLAAVYLRLGDLQKGDILFQKLLQESLNSPDRLVVLAEICYLYKIKLKEALGWCKKAVELSGSRRYLNTYAKLLYDNGFIQEAVDVGTKAIEQSPNYYPYQVNLRKYKSALN
ncbi:M56 family metallopeptidase [candidate division KSB1 bacterium]